MQVIEKRGEGGRRAERAGPQAWVLAWSPVTGDPWAPHEQKAGGAP